MSLLQLQVRDLRCLAQADIELDSRHNLIWGANGSGKTSLLEAIFLLGRGRSFRTRNSERLIRHGQSQLTVFGRTDNVPPFALGVQVARAVPQTTARINAAPAQSLTELSQAFPVQVIDPSVHKLVEEGGFRRRRWLDWAVFHVEPSFGAVWTDYSRAVKQRNAALRQQPSQARSWDPEVARLGEQLSATRQDVMSALQPVWQRLVVALSGLDVELQLSRGWAADISLAQALVESTPRDLAKGLTHRGPHRADVLIKLRGRLGREVLSRGQQKLVAIAMTLAQVALLRDTLSIVPTLLLDDPAAELDDTRLQIFIEEVRRLDCQLVLTSLQSQAAPFGAPARVFHVEQGRVGV